MSEISAKELAALKVGAQEIDSYAMAREHLRGQHSQRDVWAVIDAADAMVERAEKLLAYTQVMAELHDIMLNPPEMMDDATAKQCLMLCLQGVRDQAREALS